MAGVTSPMPTDVFFDTNVIVYAFIQTDSRSAPAEALVAAGGIISVQVLNEFVNVARRKHALDWPAIRAALASVAVFCGAPRPITATLHMMALDIAERHHYRIYDALIIAAAAEAGCRTLYSEDLAHGQTIEGVRIANPFTG